MCWLHFFFAEVLILPIAMKIDIWALGCVIFNLTALEPPYSGDNLITLGYNIVNKPPKPLPVQYSLKLQNFITKFFEKNPL